MDCDRSLLGCHHLKSSAAGRLVELRIAPAGWITQPLYHASPEAPGRSSVARELTELTEAQQSWHLTSQAPTDPEISRELTSRSDQQADQRAIGYLVKT